MSLQPFPGFVHFPTRHCVTGSLRHIYAFHGYPISEGLLLGLGAGVGFIYWHMNGSGNNLGRPVRPSARDRSARSGYLGQIAYGSERMTTGQSGEVNHGVIERAVARRRKYRGEEEYLATEIRKPMAGTRLERRGDALHQFYTPRSYGKGIRCYCALVKALPDDETLSPTYSHCSKAFVNAL